MHFLTCKKQKLRLVKSHLFDRLVKDPYFQILNLMAHFGYALVDGHYKLYKCDDFSTEIVLKFEKINKTNARQFMREDELTRIVRLPDFIIMLSLCNMSARITRIKLVFVRTFLALYHKKAYEDEQIRNLKAENSMMAYFLKGNIKSKKYILVLLNNNTIYIDRTDNNQREMGYYDATSVYDFTFWNEMHKEKVRVSVQHKDKHEDAFFIGIGNEYNARKQTGVLAKYGYLFLCRGIAYVDYQERNVIIAERGFAGIILTEKDEYKVRATGVNVPRTIFSEILNSIRIAVRQQVPSAYIYDGRFEYLFYIRGLGAKYYRIHASVNVDNVKTIDITKIWPALTETIRNKNEITKIVDVLDLSKHCRVVYKKSKDNAYDQLVFEMDILMCYALD